MGAFFLTEKHGRETNALSGKEVTTLPQYRIHIQPVLKVREIEVRIQKILVLCVHEQKSAREKVTTKA